MDSLHESTLGDLAEVFGDRLRRNQAGKGPSSGGELASVLPMSVEEVTILAKLAERHSLPLVALGAETHPEAPAKKDRIVVRFDLMRGFRLPGPDENWVEAEPGALWLELDNNLRVRGQGLTVYPTSAPRATIGGWLAQDGIGVGSYEYGWLRENVLSADVVLPGGDLRTVKGEDLGPIAAPGHGGIVVGARLRTRRSDSDMPFALAFDSGEDLAQAVADVYGRGLPLWHLGFVNAELASARNLGEGCLLFGAYPRERSPKIEDALRELADSRRGCMLTTAGAYRAWAERFFPVAPSHPSPEIRDRALIAIEDVQRVAAWLPRRAVQGTVARSGEAFLLAFDARG